MQKVFKDNWWIGELAEYGGVPANVIEAYKQTKSGAFESAKWFRDEHRQRVERNMKLMPRLFEGTPLKILDVGAGMCGHAAACRWLGHNVIGTEKPNSKYSPISKHMFIPISDYTIDVKSRLPFDDNAFDVVLCISVLTQHTPEFRALIPHVIRELSRVIKSGGQVFVGWWKPEKQAWLPEFLPENCTEETISQGKLFFKRLTKK